MMDLSSSTGRGSGKAERRLSGLKSGNAKKLIAVMIVVVIVAVVLWALVGRSLGSSSGTMIDGGKYQAVFFTNGQVYFGKLKEADRGYYVLNDIFYLQTQAAPGEDESGNPQETNSDAAADVQLIKLGSEVHGPEDEMVINREQVLFYENLKADGRVSKSIAEYKQ